MCFLSYFDNKKYISDCLIFKIKALYYLLKIIIMSQFTIFIALLIANTLLTNFKNNNVCLMIYKKVGYIFI